jgi:ferrochelatase
MISIVIRMAKSGSKPGVYHEQRGAVTELGFSRFAVGWRRSPVFARVPYGPTGVGCELVCPVRRRKFRNPTLAAQGIRSRLPENLDCGGFASGVISRNVCRQLQSRVNIPVELTMRYQNPSIPSAVQSLLKQGVDEILLIPLFPHYAMSSFETAVERVKEVAGQLMAGLRVIVQPPFYDHPQYLAALVASAAKYLDKGYDHLLFSFHGLPERQIRKSDPTGCHCLASENCCTLPSPAHGTCYRAQCFKTVEAFVKLAGVPDTKYSVAFQSRLGRDPWLKPYTDYELVRFAKQGKKKLLVICPAFVSDCLETLEEIGMRGRETFLDAGGRELTQIPCLNEHPLWLEALEGMVAKFSPTAVRLDSHMPAKRQVT